VLAATLMTGSLAVAGAGAAGSDMAPTYRANDFADGDAMSILPPR
jgi:hypothetical protein